MTLLVIRAMPRVVRVRRGPLSWWMVGTSTAAVLGGDKETRADVVARWEAKYGRPAAGYALVPGRHTERRAAELLT